LDGAFSTDWPGGDALNAAVGETVSLIALLAVLALLGWVGLGPGKRDK